MDESRKQFVEIYEQMKHDRFGGKEEWAWKFWQASRAAIEIELPAVIDAHPLGPDSAKMICAFHKNVVGECAKSIRAAGIKVKE